LKLLTARRHFEEGECHPLFFWGDHHRGNANCAKGALDSDRNTIATAPHAMYVHMGDAADYITQKDRRWKEDHIDWDLYDRDKPLLDEAVRDVTEFEAPVIDRAICALDGNHEHEANKLHVTNVTVRRLERLGKADIYCGSAALVRIIFTDKHRHACQVILNLHHGKRTAMSKATLLNTYIKKARYYPDVDILARGHAHYLGYEQEARVTCNANFTRLRDKNSYAVLTGGYLKTFMEDGSCYAEDADYDPIDIGMQRFNLWPTRSGVRIEAVA
jgi:predicted phosphodiesterase